MKNSNYKVIRAYSKYNRLYDLDEKIEYKLDLDSHHWSTFPRLYKVKRVDNRDRWHIVNSIPVRWRAQDNTRDLQSFRFSTQFPTLVHSYNN